MTPPRPGYADFDFLAYCDGRLAPHSERRRLVEARLAADPAAAGDAARDAAILSRLREGLHSAVNEPVPPHLLAILEGRPSRAPTIGLAAAGLTAAFALGWLVAANTSDLKAEERAGGLSGEVVAVLDAASAIPRRESSLVSSDAISAPDISHFGLAPVVAEDVHTPGAPVRRVLYAGAGVERLELLSHPLAPEPEQPIRIERVPEGLAAYWTSDGEAHRLSANLPEIKLREIAEDLRAGPKRQNHPSTNIVVDAPAGPAAAPIAGSDNKFMIPVRGD